MVESISKNITLRRNPVLGSFPLTAFAHKGETQIDYTSITKDLEIIVVEISLS